MSRSSTPVPRRAGRPATRAGSGVARTRSNRSSPSGLTCEKYWRAMLGACRSAARSSPRARLSCESPRRARSSLSMHVVARANWASEPAEAAGVPAGTGHSLAHPGCGHPSRTRAETATAAQRRRIVTSDAVRCLGAPRSLGPLLHDGRVSLSWVDALCVAPSPVSENSRQDGRGAGAAQSASSIYVPTTQRILASWRSRRRRPPPAPQTAAGRSTTVTPGVRRNGRCLATDSRSDRKLDVLACIGEPLSKEISFLHGPRAGAGAAPRTVVFPTCAPGAVWRVAAGECLS